MKSVGEWVSFAAWSWGWLSILKGLGEASVEEEVLKPFEDPVLLAFDSALGIGSLCIGLVGLDFKDDVTPVGIALAIIEPLPETVTLVKSNTFSSETFDINQGIKVAVDIFAGGATVFLTGLEAAEGNG